MYDEKKIHDLMKNELYLMSMVDDIYHGVHIYRLKSIFRP